jgi:hypothetical protein
MHVLGAGKQGKHVTPHLSSYHRFRRYASPATDTATDELDERTTQAREICQKNKPKKATKEQIYFNQILDAPFGVCHFHCIDQCISFLSDTCIYSLLSWRLFLHSSETDISN